MIYYIKEEIKYEERNIKTHNYHFLVYCGCFWSLFIISRLIHEAVEKSSLSARKVKQNPMTISIFMDDSGILTSSQKISVYGGITFKFQNEKN